MRILKYFKHRSNKKLWKIIRRKAYLIKWKFNKRFNIDTIFYSKKSSFRFPIYWLINISFYPTIYYNAYQKQFWWIRRRFVNIKYHTTILIIKEMNEWLRKKKPRIFKKFNIKKRFLIQSFLYLYNYFFLSVYVDLHYLIRFIKTKYQRLQYHLILTFSKNKFFINLQNYKKKSYLSISTGLFIRFFKKKKSFKKNKMIKLLMMRYIRKIFLISKMKNILLIIKKTPTFLLELISFINTTIPYKFIDPVGKQIIEEIDEKQFQIKFLYFIFVENKNFSNNKEKKRGRIKRKILRKLVFENKIID